MAYPIISAPYGFKPVSLIGGQLYAGSTREYVIQNNYSTAIYYGDFVTLTNGLITRATVTNATTAKQFIGVFLGCKFTDFVTKQKRYSQFYPGSQAVGDIVAIVADDPDTVFKAALVTTSGGSTIASASQAIVGLNLAASDFPTPTNALPGDSYNALVAPTATPTTALPFRVLSLVQETASASSAVSTAGTSTTSIPFTNATAATLIGTAIPQGADISYIPQGGSQVVQTGTFVTTAVTPGAIGGSSTTVTANVAVTIPANATVVFTSYPEVLVKVNFGIHNYYAA